MKVEFGDVVYRIPIWCEVSALVVIRDETGLVIKAHKAYIIEGDVTEQVAQAGFCTTHAGSSSSIPDSTKDSRALD